MNKNENETVTVYTLECRRCGILKNYINWTPEDICPICEQRRLFFVASEIRASGGDGDER